MIKLLTDLNISINDITDITNPTTNQLVINRADFVIKRYTGGWTNFKIYTVREFDNIVSNASAMHRGRLLEKVSVEKGKGLVDVDFSNEYFKKLNGVEFGANYYEHPTSDKHLDQQMITLFDSYAERLVEIERVKFNTLVFDKPSNMVDFKGSNNEVLRSLLIQNVNLLEEMMISIIKIDELMNKILIQDLPVINNLVNDYLTRLKSLKELFAEMYEKIKRAETQLGIERETSKVSNMVEKIIEKRTVNK